MARKKYKYVINGDEISRVSPDDLTYQQGMKWKNALQLLRLKKNLGSRGREQLRSGRYEKLMIDNGLITTTNIQDGTPWHRVVIDDTWVGTTSHTVTINTDELRREHDYTLDDDHETEEGITF